MTNNELFSKASSPERVGIPSSAILNFIERIDKQQICMHGFMLVRKGQIAAEGYWAPYQADSMHRMYSISKSFVALAIGLMIDEGKLSLEDRVARFFADKAPQDLHPYLAEATVRDLLMMSTPHDTNSYNRHDRDFAATFFHKKPSHPPGTIFSYDTAATVVLGTIVERISGVPFLTYMREPLLDPIGFSNDAWCVQTPEGTSWGGSGVICRLRDMAKLAYVCLNNGRWQDEQLISEAYIRAATSKQIDNSLLNHRFGYGYQIWMLRDNGFAFRGMGSQFAFCFPEQEFIFACNADTQGDGSSGEEIENAFYEEIYSKLQPSPLPDNSETNARLNETIAGLKILPQRGSLSSSFKEKVDGKWYRLNDNPMQMTRTRFVFDGEDGVWEYVNATGAHQLRFGIGRTVSGLFPETHYFGERIGTPSGRGYQCLSSAAWVEEHKLNLLVYITDDYLGTLKISFAFKDDQISIYAVKVAEWFLDEYTGFAGGELAEA
jgi:CubicO group peptidase (beta-lactamase class C family)